MLRAPLEVPARHESEGDVVVRSNFEKKDYLNAVVKAKEYIAAGDIFQVVLAQRFEVDLPTCAIRDLSGVADRESVALHVFPQDAGCHDRRLIAGNARKDSRSQHRVQTDSPEPGRAAQDEAEDDNLAEELRADEKERAEHIMLVDLGRNDLGRVSKYGTVRVEDLMFIERYSHVMHLASTLKGELRSDVDRWDTLMACFPAGTVSGAPKVRAMQIIDEMEPTKRGVYAGTIMYVDFSNNLDSCIGLRTLVVRGNKGYIQAGAGIVADSVPESEYMETVNKSRALHKGDQSCKGWI